MSWSKAKTKNKLDPHKCIRLPVGIELRPHKIFHHCVTLAVEKRIFDLQFTFVDAKIT